ncbi:MAG: DUF3037 domain-containing protein [Chthoniobacteraceae bacterium]
MKHPETRYACNYAVLQFLPYPETGEFVNLGVVVHSPEKCFFDFLLERHKTARVTSFFPELNAGNFRSARSIILMEMKRVKSLIDSGKDAPLSRQVFRELVRPREAIFRFGETRTILTPDVNAVTEDLFAQYVLRNFAQHKEYQETIMARKFYDVLRQFRPDKVFLRNVQVGTEEYHVRIPIASEARKAEHVPLRVIKPLDLARTEPTAITEHGDAWLQRMRRLKKIRCLPDRFVFVVRRPAEEACLDAAEDILSELADEGAVLVGEKETEQLVKMAAD